MRRYPLRLETLSPLALRADHAQDGVSGTSFITGTTLLGCLAAFHQQVRPDAHEEFERFFLREQILYPNLYPARFNVKSIPDSSAQVYPFPRTAMTCKRHGGFRYPDYFANGEKNDGHGVRDSLLDWAIYSLSKDDTARLKLFNQRHKNCVCGEPMDRCEGFYGRNDIQKDRMVKSSASTRLRTFTGVNRQTGTVQDRILYNRQVFTEGMHFTGDLLFAADDEQLVEDFNEFLEECDVDVYGPVHMGTGRSRGLGQIALAVTQDQREQEFAGFRNRLDAFNRKVHEQARQAKADGLEPHYFFAVTLHSPLIQHDDRLRHYGTLNTALLQHLLTPVLQQSSLSGLTCWYQNAAVQRVTGWQTLWGTPRIDDYAIAAGSVFLFSCATATFNEQIFQALYQLEQQGAGERRAEGFGRLYVSEQFHQIEELI